MPGPFSNLPYALPPNYPCQVDVDNWVEPAEPLTPAEHARDYILQHRLFNATPSSGTLPPGASAELCLTYSPAPQPGAHRLPLFLGVADGKRLQLLLSGSTTPEDAQALLLLPTHQDFQLQVRGQKRTVRYCQHATFQQPWRRHVHSTVQAHGFR